MTNSADWLKGWRQLADSGDPDALIVVAWEYVKGDLLEKDFDRAVTLFREAEKTRPELARFNLAKAKISVGNETFSKDIRQDCDAGFGPALYLMGAVEANGVFHDKDIDQAIHYFLRAAQSNHLVSEFFAWRLTTKNLAQWIRTSPRALLVFLKAFAIKLRSADDLRVLT